VFSSLPFSVFETEPCSVSSYSKVLQPSIHVPDETFSENKEKELADRTIKKSAGNDYQLHLSSRYTMRMRVLTINMYILVCTAETDFR